MGFLAQPRIEMIGVSHLVRPKGDEYSYQFEKPPIMIRMATARDHGMCASEDMKPSAVKRHKSLGMWMEYIVI